MPGDPPAHRSPDDSGGTMPPCGSMGDDAPPVCICRLFLFTVLRT